MTIFFNIFVMVLGVVFFAIGWFGCIEEIVKKNQKDCNLIQSRVWWDFYDTGHRVEIDTTNPEGWKEFFKAMDKEIEVIRKKKLDEYFVAPKTGKYLSTPGGIKEIKHD